MFSVFYMIIFLTAGYKAGVINHVCKALGAAGFATASDVIPISLLLMWEEASSTAEPTPLDMIIQLRATVRALQKSAMPETPFTLPSWR